MGKPELRLQEAARLIRNGRTQDAVPLLEAAADQAASLGSAHALLLEALLSLGRRREALEVFDRALQLERTTADAFDTLAFFARQLGRHQLSNAFYRRTVELDPGDAQFWYNLATSERTFGRLEEAAAACRRALLLDPDYRPAMLLRSEVSRATPSANHVHELLGRLAATDGGPDAVFLHYALGKELHELGEYDDAFAAFERGAALRRRSLRYDVAQDEAKLRRIAEVYSTGACAIRDAPIGRHIFIIGLPRSGTTLTERILGGLPGVVSNDETDNFSVALLQAAAGTGADVFERASHADHARVASEYEALAVRDGFAGKIIEKLPFNYLYVGSILRAFPNTPIISVRRNPIDACFAMFRTLFGAAYPFSYDFDDLARYYAAYERLMGHWETLFPDQITRVDYEDLVTVPDLIAPRLAARCGLTWTDQALDITQNVTASLTASAAQVRRGIYSSSSGIWRRYERHLQPLIAHLRTHGVDLGVVSE